MHHAYLIEGEQEPGVASIDEDLSVSPDVTIRTLDRMTIDDARLLTEEASRRPVERTHRIFVISFRVITHEAQNALLKLLEEPHETIRFYFVTTRTDALLPTLHSRLHTLRSSEEKIENTTAKSFLALTLQERLDLIAEKVKGKDHVWQKQLCVGLEKWASAHKEEAALRALIFSEGYSGFHGASEKMLLEHIAFAFPIVTR